MVFHIINRANARARIFAKQADYTAFGRGKAGQNYFPNVV
jgi:hypothetical protein